MPEIRECCVISSRDKRVGEEVKAFIVVKPDFEDRITKDDVVVNAKLIFPKKGKIKLPKNANLNFPISLQR